METRRTFLKAASSAMVSGLLMRGRPALAQVAPRVRLVDTQTLTIGFEESGNPLGSPMILLHGWPDDVRAWDAVVQTLVDACYRAIMQPLRRFAPTRLR